MNTSFILSMKNIFFHAGSKSFRKWIGAATPKIIYIITIAFVSFFVAGCNGNDSTDRNKKKTDTVFVQQNNQRGEGEGMEHGPQGMDSMHGGMGHGPRGMDSMNHKRHQ